MTDCTAIHRGHPSYVWRAGQERRLNIVREHVALEGKRTLDVGCGLGMYTEALGCYSDQVYGVEVELDRAVAASGRAQGVAQAVGEALPFSDGTFDVVFSHEVLEHVADDRRTAHEMVRVTRPGGQIAIYVPNRRWPFETHGIYWRGEYHFGNIPLINYLPDALRSRLAWHVRVYTRRDLLALFDGLPVRLVVHRTVYPGFDNVVHRWPSVGGLIRAISYRLERLPVFGQFGLSHFLVLERQAMAGEWRG
ncbi:MAG: class I SAM-dependent methyltransferase [Anaerolineae bacterium]|nr:class I SAM-dependent methyltransferase [Anaerolineae bacterium]